MNTSIDNQLKEFEDFVGIFFPPEDVKKIKIMSEKGGDSLWGYDHIDILGALAGFETRHPILDRLRLPYVLLSSHYFLLDDTIDHHLLQEDDVLYSTHLLFLVYSQVFLFTENSISEQAKTEFLQRIAKLISENASAIRLEIRQRAGFYKPSKDENYQMVAGRSNSTIQFYEILCFFAGKETNNKVISLLSDLVYYLQLGDDLGDWSQDFKRGNFTPLLQECFQQLPVDKRNDFSAIESVLYTSGIYEQYVAQIVNNLDRIKSQFLELHDVDARPTCKWIDGARSKAYYLLSNMIAKKLSFLSQSK